MILFADRQTYRLHGERSVLRIVINIEARQGTESIRNVFINIVQMFNCIIKMSTFTTKTFLAKTFLALVQY